VDKYPTPSDGQPTGLERVLKVQLASGGKLLGEVDLARSEEAGAEIWLARTPTSRGWAKVNTGAASDVAAELGAIVGN
jgi:hypothetical protein